MEHSNSHPHPHSDQTFLHDQDHTGNSQQMNGSGLLALAFEAEEPRIPAHAPIDIDNAMDGALHGIPLSQQQQQPIATTQPQIGPEITQNSLPSDPSRSLLVPAREGAQPFHPTSTPRNPQHDVYIENLITLHRPQVDSAQMTPNTSNTSNNATRNANQRRARRIQIRVPQGSRIRVAPPRAQSAAPDTHAAHQRTIVHHHHHHTPIPPLLPLPLPDHHQRFKSDPPSQQYSEYQCSICWEVMEHPVGCGHCPARFCRDCLLRAIQSTTAPPAAHTVSLPTCPACRHPTTPERWHPDFTLQAKIGRLDSMPCRFQGCTAVLRLTDMKKHEESCPMTIMSCRFHSLGCPWTGCRQDLTRHENEDCTLSKLKVLVHQHRAMRHQFSDGLGHLHQQVNGMAAMMELHRSNLARLATKPISNPCNILAFLCQLTCSTPHFLHTKELWVNFWARSEGRATVANFLTVTPSILLATKAFVSHYRLMVSRLGTLATEPTEDFVPGCLTTLLLGVVLALILWCLHMDGRSAVEWTLSPNPTAEKPLLIESTVAVLFLILHSVSISVSTHSALTSVWTLALVLTGTIFFPVLVTTVAVSTPTIGPSTPHETTMKLDDSIIRVGRTMDPVLFAMRFGFLLHAYGLLPSFDAWVMKRLVAQWLLPKSRVAPRNSRFQGPFFESLRDASTSLMATRLVWSIKGAFDDVTKAGGYFTMIWQESVMALVSLLSLDLIVVGMCLLGWKAGNVVYQAAVKELGLAPHTYRRDFVVVGVATAVGWMAISILIVVT